MTLKAPLEILTSRLVLAAPAPTDARLIFERYASDLDVTRFVGWPRHRSLQETEAFVALSIASWDRWPAGPYLIRSREDRRLLGSTGLAFESDTEAMTGYVLAKDSWGKGYATEALRAMIDLSRQLGLQRLSALCHPEHQASRRVLEKCSFALDRHWPTPMEFPNHLRGVLQEVSCYRLNLSP